MAIEDSTLPIFLGMSHRAARRGYEWDFLGLTRLLLVPFFPQRLTGLQCVIGIDPALLRMQSIYSFRILLTDQSQPSNQGWIDQNLVLESHEAEPVMRLERGAFAVQPAPLEGGQTTFGWGLFQSQNGPGGIEIFPAPAPPLILSRPCSVLVEVEVKGNRYHLGEFVCGFAPPPPLTEEERRAIASRPGARKAIMVHLCCKVCGCEASYFSQLNPYEGRPKNVPPKAVTLSNAPEIWSCTCGEQSVDLIYLKQGFHDLFRRTQPHSSDDPIMQFSPLYEAGRIQDINGEYEQLIEATTDEESVQKYLEEHPVFWSFLSPTKILHKPAVLTKKKADFGIVSTQKVLYLVEIEKPTTRLTNQDGSISAEIQKGANQIRDWQMVVGNHRLALLSELDLKESDVHEIRYLLIGGLARRTNAEGLTKLRRSPLAPNTDFYCFDELGSFLHTLAGELRRL